MLDFARLQKFTGFQVPIICKVSEWSDVFEVSPAEIERQIGLAHGWILVNPKKAPKSNIMRYLYNWMLIAQRKGSLLKRPRENFQEQKPDEDQVMTGEDFARMRKVLRNGHS